MFKINDNYLKLPGSYLFSTIGKKVAAYQQANPDKEIIRLGIGDVTQPLASAVIEDVYKRQVFIQSIFSKLLRNRSKLFFVTSDYCNLSTAYGKSICHG